MFQRRSIKYFISQPGVQNWGDLVFFFMHVKVVPFVQSRDVTLTYNIREGKRLLLKRINLNTHYVFIVKDQFGSVFVTRTHCVSFNPNSWMHFLPHRKLFKNVLTTVYFTIVCSLLFLLVNCCFLWHVTATRLLLNAYVYMKGR